MSKNDHFHSRSRGVKKVLPPLDRTAYAKRIEGEIEAAECDVFYARQSMKSADQRGDLETYSKYAEKVRALIAKQGALRIESQSYQPVTA